MSERELLKQCEKNNVKAARDDLLEFILQMFPKYQDNWHHQLICDRLTALKDQTRQRLMIFVPPQYGKSEIVSRCFPAWMLGHKPDAKIILASYASELADSFNRDCQRYMESAEYRNIFPGTKIQCELQDTKTLKRTHNIVETNENGYLFTVGVGGTTTGRTADPLLIIDDPIKDFKEADSVVVRKRKIEWFNAVCQTRLPPTANIIIMHTRWHEGDLGGHILEQMQNDDKATRYEVINLPASCIGDEKYEFDPRDEGQALWPQHKGTEEELDQIRHDVGERTWWALYQQRPRIQGGNMVQSEWWRRYFKVPENPSEWCITVDASFKDLDTSDFVVITCWCRLKLDMYKVDQFRGRWDIIKTIKNLMRMIHKWPKARAKLVETKANGPAVIQLLKNEVSGMIEFEPIGSKESRVNSIIPDIESGHVHLPHESVAHFDVAGTLDEWSSFPNGKNDDIVDADTMAIMRLGRHQRSFLRRMVSGL